MDSANDPLVCRAHGWASRSRAASAIVFVVISPFILWLALTTSAPSTTRLFLYGWAGMVVWIAYRTFRSDVLGIEVDPDGVCTFRAWTRVVTSCRLVEVSEIQMRTNGRNLSIHAAGRRLRVMLPMDGMTMFVERVRSANPTVTVKGL
jgi:hypothetical protein